MARRMRRTLTAFLGRTSGTANLRCIRCGKQHPPEKVILSEGNPSKQPRPYHCLCCPETRPMSVRADYWQKMTVAEAQGCRRHGRHAPAPGGCCLRSVSN